MHNTGKTHLLSGMCRERSVLLPNGVLNFSEMGYPNLVAYAEFGIMVLRAPSDMTLKKIFEIISLATKHPDFISKLAIRGRLLQLLRPQQSMFLELKARRRVGYQLFND
jgi:hypothetical protein